VDRTMISEREGHRGQGGGRVDIRTDEKDYAGSEHEMDRRQD
jgi:hypothetical protein